ncbi:MAG: TetR/AcrR family transcriptional regulator [Armatimonadota bacterium]|nr:TetR/AcrR family transcriptional regulator [Armatimonadota bacterium]
MATPRIERKELTRRQILEAARQVFSERGYHGTSMDDIAQASGTSKGALYFHFSSKEELFHALVEEFAQILAEEVAQAIQRERGAVAKVEAALRTVLEAASRHRQLAKIVLVEWNGLGPAFAERRFQLRSLMADLIKTQLDEAVEEGRIPPVDTTITAYAWLGAINEVIVRWLHTGEPEPLSAVLPTLRTLLLRSIGVDPDRPSGERR